MTYVHAEAFCLMTYQADDGESEVIWNSRDGVTPFVIGLRSGKAATHVNWKGDKRAPDHRPAIGDRIFVDLSAEKHHENVVKMIDSQLDDPEVREILLKMYGSREHAISTMIRGFQPGQPSLIEVDQEWLDKRGGNQRTE